MKPMISGCGGRVPREENRCRAEDFDVLTQPLVLRFELLDLGVVVGGRPRPVAGVDLRLRHPTAHRLPGNSQLLSNRHHGGRLRRILATMLGHQTHRTSAELRIDLLRHA